jgi:alkaline phosphatase D
VAGAQLPGDRQLKFLKDWARDWREGVRMKVVLSQTRFVNRARLPPPANTDAVVRGLPILKPDDYAEGDIVVTDQDANAWPQAGRDAAPRIWRKCAALHVCGDRHPGSTTPYGVEEWRDASFAFCSEGRLGHHYGSSLTWPAERP